MDYQTLAQLIGTLGFPIVMCGLLFWYMVKQNEAHATEAKETREAISKLELAITKLCDKLDDVKETK